MKKIILILITNFVLFLVPILANIATISQNTEFKITQNEHKSRLKLKPKTQTWFIKFFLISGFIAVLVGWGIVKILSLLPNSNFIFAFTSVIIALGLGYVGGLFLITGIVLYIVKLSERKNRKDKTIELNRPLSNFSY